jgi:transposase-like protein
MDETYVGGKRRVTQPQAVKPGKRAQDRLGPFSDKAAVVSVLQRGGRVQSQHVKRVTAETLRPIIESMVAEDAHLMTDTSSALKTAGKIRKHDQVNHVAKEYVRYENGICISTNTIEGYFSLLKRGIYGVYHQVGKQHLHRYLSEFDFRYNARKITDGQRTLVAIKQTGGKRLMLKDSRLPNQKPSN